MKKVKKRFNLQAAFEDLERRQKIFNDSKNTIETMFANIQHNYDVMTMTLPEDKKDFVKKEVKAVQVRTYFGCYIIYSQILFLIFERKNLKLWEDLRRRSRKLMNSVLLLTISTKQSR